MVRKPLPSRDRPSRLGSSHPRRSGPPHNSPGKQRIVSIPFKLILFTELLDAFAIGFTRFYIAFKGKMDLMA